MSACADKELMLHGLVDGELDAANAVAMEAHLKACPGCAAELERLRALAGMVRAPGVAYAAPGRLAGRIAESLGTEARRPRLPRLRTIAPWAVGGAFAAMAASLALVAINPGGHERAIENEVVAGHIRSLQASHLTDVAASDRRTVKPWFDGRIDFAPPVIDLAGQGYTLVGGRLDYLHGRAVAAVVYRRGRHAINLFVWPSRRGETLGGHAIRQGYAISYWTRGGLEFWAVSDLDQGELDAFARAYRQASAA